MVLTDIVMLIAVIQPVKYQTIHNYNIVRQHLKEGKKEKMLHCLILTDRCVISGMFYIYAF